MNIKDLRESLADALNKVKAGTMDKELAASVCQIANCIIDTARVEVAYINALGGVDSTHESSFIGDKSEPLPSGILSITRHRIK